MKRSAGRPQDLLDIAALERIALSLKADGSQLKHRESRGWEQHRHEQMRSWMRLTTEQRLDWLESAKQFAAEALGAATPLRP